MKDYELKVFARLIENNNDYLQSLMIIKNNDNKEIIDYIINQLQIGISIDNIFDSIDNPLAKRIGFFAKFIPFNKSIELTSRIEERKKQLINGLLEEISYPLITSILSICLLIFFTIYIIPLFNELSIDSSYLSFLDIFSNIIEISCILFLGLITIFLIYIFVNKEKNYSIFKKIIENNKVLRICYSYFFSFYLARIIENGISTKRTFEILINYGDSLIIKNTAEELYAKLNEGVNFEKIFENKMFDELLISFIKYGIKGNNLVESLNEYLNIRIIYLKNFLKKISRNVQIFSYLMIGSIVVILYQSMLLPLDIINDL